LGAYPFEAVYHQLERSTATPATTTRSTHISKAAFAVSFFENSKTHKSQREGWLPLKRKLQLY